MGRVTEETTPLGKRKRYAYNAAGLLSETENARKQKTTYSYDARGKLTHTKRPNGTEEICTYNEAGLLVEQKDVYGEEVLTDYTYTYDGYGNIVTVAGTASEEGITNLTSAEMTYDGDNRLLTYNGKKLRYDADGNMTYGPLNGQMQEMTYDCRNRLVRAGDTTYTYDSENIRIRTETPEYTEEYVTDTVSSSLSRVLSVTVYEKEEGAQEKTGAGITTLYVYGSGLIYEYTGDIYLYHHYNNLGSTMKLTDRKGQVTAEYAYGAYGELISGDASITRFLYNGRCGVTTDDNGLYYMRQRYYNPEIKRFLNQDVVRGSMENSQSLNRYSYVQGNPVSYTDPFGLSPLNGLFSGTGIWHAVLGVLGCVSGPVGMIANAVDAGIYFFVDKDYGMGALSLLSCVSMGASGIVKATASGSRLAKGAGYVQKASSLISNTASFLMNSSMAMENAFNMYEKYEIQGREFDSDTPWEFLALGLNVFGMGVSGKGMAGDTRGLSRMMEADGIGGKLGNAFKGGTGTLGEETFTRYMPDGRQVTDVTNLPGSDGIRISRRLKIDEMTFLTQEYGVEFAQVYHRGAGKNGGGGHYVLYSGTVNSVSIARSLSPDAMLINHTHPGGTAWPSSKDMKLLQNLQNLGSPQKVSEIIPIGKNRTVFFDVNGVKK